jgi:hypothetical protein
MKISENSKKLKWNNETQVFLINFSFDSDFKVDFNHNKYKDNNFYMNFPLIPSSINVFFPEEFSPAVYFPTKYTDPNNNIDPGQFYNFYPHFIILLFILT